MKRDFSSVSRIVCKIGSSLLTDQHHGLNQAAMRQWAAQIAQLRQRNIEVILISSGAIAEGIKRLHLTHRPKQLNELQAVAAIGQMGLVQGWETALSVFGLHSAQVLLTHDDLKARERYLNARSTLLKLLEYGVIPVINENDTVVTDEIKLGDNDTLGALVCNLIDAHVLILLTDQDGLFDSDPRYTSEAKKIDHAMVDDITLLRKAEGSTSMMGTGGMITKVKAAKRASRSGTSTVIAHGNTPDVLVQIINNAPIGTYIKSDTTRMAARKQWLANHLQVAGTLVLDEGAIKAITQNKRSLLPVGILSVQGVFLRGALIACKSQQGIEIARGLSNYAAIEIEKIQGQESSAVIALLDYQAEPEIIHRDNLVLSELDPIVQKTLFS